MLTTANTVRFYRKVYSLYATMVDLSIQNYQLYIIQVTIKRIKKPPFVNGGQMLNLMICCRIRFIVLFHFGELGIAIREFSDDIIKHRHYKYS